MSRRPNKKADDDDDNASAASDENDDDSYMTLMSAHTKPPKIGETCPVLLLFM